MREEAPLGVGQPTFSGTDAPSPGDDSEPNEGAYTINVPQGWKISGGVRRRTPVDVRSAVNVVSPDGTIHLLIGRLRRTASSRACSVDPDGRHARRSNLSHASFAASLRSFNPGSFARRAGRQAPR